MTRKDYEMIADRIKRTRACWEDTTGSVGNPTALNAIDMAAMNLAQGLEYENAGFDRDRFLRACGYRTEVTA